MGSIVFSIGLVEFILRLLFPVAYSMEVKYVADDHLGVRLQPSQVYSLKSGGTCSINSFGFRDAENIEKEKSADTLRIVVLGGSSTFCYQTDDNKIWTTVLEDLLKQRVDHKVEVVNAGVPGYSIFESTVNYLYQIRELKPDIVIIYHS